MADSKFIGGIPAAFASLRDESWAPFIESGISLHRANEATMAPKPMLFAICYLLSVISFEPQARMMFFLSFSSEDKAPRRLPAGVLCRLAPLRSFPGCRIATSAPYGKAIF
jgi:hypothetical protein